MTMSCKEYESLMADALGDELSPEDRPAFEAHLASCERCRREYETSREAVAAMRTLPGPQRVAVHREGDRLVIDDSQAAALGASGDPRGLSPAVWWARGVFRYAASVLVAFTAGYIAHAGLMSSDASRPVTPVVQVGDSGTQTDGQKSLQGALVSAYTRNPHRSDLAKCLIAMAKTTR
jgi:anti-sigma factor RsiW